VWHGEYGIGDMYPLPNAVDRYSHWLISLTALFALDVVLIIVWTAVVGSAWGIKIDL
jgi:hypothetical protein